MPKSPFGLPPAWDPGYALPANVVDEGLARHAFVTEMQPRGSFDNPKVGTAGYAVPQYVKDEGLGRGTYTTKMAPGGSYFGPKVPNWLNQRPAKVSGKRGRDTFVTGLSGLGTAVEYPTIGVDQAVPEPYKSFGDKAAQVLLGAVAGLPASKRASHLKAAADKLDKTLWSRTADIAKRYQASGMSTALAFPAALSRALGMGLLAETIAIGTGKKKVSSRRAEPQTLIGTGCYGVTAGALGDSTPLVKPTTNLLSAVSGRLAQVFQKCEPPPGYTWNGHAYVDTGDWRYPAVAAPGCPDPSTVPVVNSTTDPKAYFMLKADDGSIPPMKIRTNAKGSYWRLASPTTSQTYGDLQRTDHLPDSAKSWLKKVITSGANGTVANGPSKMAPIVAGPAPGQQAKWLQQILEMLSPLGIGHDSSVNWDVLTGAQPLARAKHPVSGEDYELKLVLDRVKATAQDDLGLPIATTLPGAQTLAGAMAMLQQHRIATHPDVTSNPLALYVVWAPKSQGLFDSIWNGLKWLVTEFVAVISTALAAVGDLVCATMSAPTAPAGAAVGAMAVGAPPQAAAGGANIAKSLCQNQPVPYMPQSGWGVPLLIAAGVAGVAILATRK